MADYTDPEDRAAARRFNEKQKALSAFLANASLTCFVGGFGLWWSETGSSYWILGGGLSGIVFLAFSLEVLTYLKDVE